MSFGGRCVGGVVDKKGAGGGGGEEGGECVVVMATASRDAEQPEKRPNGRKGVDSFKKKGKGAIFFFFGKNRRGANGRAGDRRKPAGRKFWVPGVHTQPEKRVVNFFRVTS